MKCYPMTGSSGSSIHSKNSASQPTRSRITKSSARPKKPSKVSQAAKGESPQAEEKWQAFIDSAREVTTDNETVRAHLFSALEEESRKEEAEKISPTDAGECFEYDVKGLMEKIYRDLHNVAAAQASRSVFGGSGGPRWLYGEVSDIDLLLREVSVGVARAIGSALAYVYDPECPPPDETLGIGEEMTRCSSCEDRAHERYGKLAADLGWKFLSKLAHSANFCEMARNLDASAWPEVSAVINENAVSLTVFAECCGLEWWTELIRLNRLFPPSFDFTQYQPTGPKNYNPHKWIVTSKPEDVRRPTFQGKHQLNIHKNIYRGNAFRNSPPPSHWPPNRPYPEDPTLVRYPSFQRCLTCKSRVPCICSFDTNPLIWHPLVELRDYGHKGVGVRALQRIPKGAILAEYLGEILPSGYGGDSIYGFDFSLPGRPSDEVIATISAKRYGNWTRFINHSCNASTKFRIVTQGGRHRCVVQSVREIEVFEEVTVDYGFGYWRYKTCECGVEGCYENVKRAEVDIEVEGNERDGTVVYEDQEASC